MLSLLSSCSTSTCGLTSIKVSGIAPELQAKHNHGLYYNDHQLSDRLKEQEDDMPQGMPAYAEVKGYGGKVQSI